MESVKVTVCGDGAVGKTCMLISCSEDRFPQEYVPTIVDNYTAHTEYNGKKYTLEIWDTAGQEEYDNIRQMSYADTKTIVCCFSIGSKISADNVRSSWKPEFQKLCPSVPILLVGTKLDLRESGEGQVSKEEGMKLKDDIGATAYLECSARSQENLKQLYTEIIKVYSCGVGNKNSKDNASCCIIL